MLSVNCRKIRIYNVRNINYNFIIIIIMQRDNALIKKKDTHKRLSCFLKCR